MLYIKSKARFLLCALLLTLSGLSVAETSYLVISGAGAPSLSPYDLTYKLLEEEAKKRQIDLVLVDFSGIGQHPNTGSGLDIVTSKDRIRHAISNKTSDHFVCLAYGCLASASLLVEAPELFAAYKSITFWALPSQSRMWQAMGHSSAQLIAFNKKTKMRGFQFSPTFFDHYQPLAYLVEKFPAYNIALGCGTEDYWCPTEFPHYLQSLTPKAIKAKTIKGAGHHVNTESENEVKIPYLNFIFAHAGE